MGGHQRGQSLNLIVAIAASAAILLISFVAMAIGIAIWRQRRTQTLNMPTDDVAVGPTVGDTQPERNGKFCGDSFQTESY